MRPAVRDGRTRNVEATFPTGVRNVSAIAETFAERAAFRCQSPSAPQGNCGNALVGVCDVWPRSGRKAPSKAATASDKYIVLREVLGTVGS